MIPPTPWRCRWPPGPTTLVHEVASARRLGRPFLFSQDNSPQERAAESRSISTMMLAVDEDLELRSIRRGGLTAMAQLGLPYEEILLFSQRHVEAPSLPVLGSSFDENSQCPWSGDFDDFDGSILLSEDPFDCETADASSDGRRPAHPQSTERSRINSDAQRGDH
jgi:hypothetical protein